MGVMYKRRGLVYTPQLVISSSIRGSSDKARNKCSGSHSFNRIAVSAVVAILGAVCARDMFGIEY
jgi:hypothetical protein